MDEPKHGDGKRKNEPRTTLRLPDRLKALLKSEAERQHRSVHNLIISILWDYFS